MVHLYQELLLDHYRNPRNRGTLKKTDFCAEQHNSSCGDQVIFSGTVDDGNIISAITFEGKGCVISQATASLLSEHVLQTHIDAVLLFDQEMILALIGMRLGPVRLMCALLPLIALQKGIISHKNKK